jgi:hypothetical protein
VTRGKRLPAGARNYYRFAQSVSVVCSTLMARRPKRRSRSLSAARRARMPSPPSRIRSVILNVVILRSANCNARRIVSNIAKLPSYYAERNAGQFRRPLLGVKRT